MWGPWRGRSMIPTSRCKVQGVYFSLVSSDHNYILQQKPLNQCNQLTRRACLPVSLFLLAVLVFLSLQSHWGVSWRWCWCWWSLWLSASTNHCLVAEIWRTYEPRDNPVLSAKLHPLCCRNHVQMGTDWGKSSCQKAQCAQLVYKHRSGVTLWALMVNNSDYVFIMAPVGECGLY